MYNIHVLYIHYGSWFLALLCHVFLISDLNSILHYQDLLYLLSFYAHFPGILLHASVCAKSPQSCATLCNLMDWNPTRLLCPWDFPHKTTGVGCHALFQGIFSTQGLNPRLMSPALAGRFFSTGTTWEVLIVLHILFKKLINLS